jgi:hypothetical protein
VIFAVEEVAVEQDFLRVYPVSPANYRSP